MSYSRYLYSNRGLYNYEVPYTSIDPLYNTYPSNSYNYPTRAYYQAPPTSSYYPYYSRYYQPDDYYYTASANRWYDYYYPRRYW